MAVDFGPAVQAGEVAVVAAGAAILLVIVAIRVIDWLKLVIIEREASREYEDRYSDR